MRTRICDQFGIDVPIFGFSHCRDVVAAISRAGGLGVLGAATITAEQLDLELSWLDEQLEGKPYGVNVLMAASFVDGTPEELEAMIPEEHRRFVAELEERFGIPPLPENAAPPTGIFGSIEFRGMPEVGLEGLEVAFAHDVSVVVSALGPTPREVVERAHERGMLVGGMVGAGRHAQKHVEAGADFVVAAGNEGAGHNSHISTMVLVPEVVDAVAPVPVLAAGGVANGRQIAAALALGADGVWTGSLWVACAESEFLPEQIGRVLRAGSHDTVETRSWSGKPTRFLRDPWNSAWEEPGAPEPLPTPLQRILVGRSHHKMLNARMGEMLAVPIGQVVGQITSVRKVQDIIYDLVTEYADAMERLQSLSPPER
jgi:NAD(P)H-dependent flavin oxidoreductase YrpB (nitropropane dioxygenase family)